MQSKQCVVKLHDLDLTGTSEKALLKSCLAFGIPANPILSSSLVRRFLA